MQACLSMGKKRPAAAQVAAWHLTLRTSAVACADLMRNLTELFVAFCGQELESGPPCWLPPTHRPNFRFLSHLARGSDG